MANETRGRLGVVLDFMRILWAIDHGLQRASKRMASSLGVTGPQRLVIRIVGRFPDISPGDIAEVLHLHPSTVTGILQRLAQRGAIRRMPDPQDRRRLSLRLTRKGLKSDQTAHGTIEEAVRDALHGASVSDLAGSRRLFGRLERSLNALADTRGKSVGATRRDKRSVGRAPMSGLRSLPRLRTV